MNKKILTFIMLVFGMLLLAGCDNDDNPPPPVTLSGISISPAQVLGGLPIGVTQQFTATGTYSDNSVQDITTSVIWSSSAPDTASVDGGGLAIGEAAGEANITASGSGLTSNVVALEVINPVLLSITVAPATVPNPLAVGRSMQFQAEGVFDNTKTYDITSYVTWASSNQDIATINQTGVATAARAGTTSISASAAAVPSNVVALTTAIQVQYSLIIEPQNLDALPINRQQQFVALLRYADGSLQNVTDTAIWTSSDSAIANVDTGVNRGMVRGEAIGSATITARDTITSMENTLIVEVNDATVETVTVIPTNPADLPPGNTQAFTATGTFSYGVDRVLKGTGSWSVSDPEAASIAPLTESEAIARVTGLAEGDLQVIYTDYESDGTLTGKQGESPLTVTAALLLSIELLPEADQSVAAGHSVLFTATGNYGSGDNRDITQDVIWESSDTTVGVFDIETKGKFTTLDVALGSTTDALAKMLDNDDILVTSPSTTVTVNNATLVSLLISPEDATVVIGETEQYTAWGMLDNNEQVDYTDRVTWSSDDEAIATVSNAAGTEGQVTAVSVGSATIRVVDSQTGINSNTGVYSPDASFICQNFDACKVPGLRRDECTIFLATCLASDQQADDCAQGAALICFETELDGI